MIDAVPELAPLSGRGQVREPEVDPLLHHPLQAGGEQGGEQRLLVGGEAERQHLVALMPPDEDRRFRHLVHQRVMATDGLGTPGHEPNGRPGEHGVDERPTTRKMQVDRATGHAGLGGHIGQGESRQAEPAQE